MTDHADRATAFPNLQLLTESLRAVATAFDQARMSGLSVSVPDPLYLACLEIVERHDLPGDKPSGARRTQRDPVSSRAPASAIASADRASERVKIQDVPLRRLVWQVIDPGEEFTVADVTARIAELGASWPATAVSNVLGYWSSRDRLTRVRKGTYSYSRPGSLSDSLTSPNDRQQEGPAASTSRASRARGKEHGDVPSSRTRRQAAS